VAKLNRKVCETLRLALKRCP